MKKTILVAVIAGLTTTWAVAEPIRLRCDANKPHFIDPKSYWTAEIDLEAKTMVWNWHLTNGNTSTRRLPITSVDDKTLVASGFDSQNRAESIEIDRTNGRALQTTELPEMKLPETKLQSAKVIEASILKVGYECKPLKPVF